MTNRRCFKMRAYLGLTWAAHEQDLAMSSISRRWFLRFLPAAVSGSGKATSVQTWLPQGLQELLRVARSLRRKLRGVAKRAYVEEIGTYPILAQAFRDAGLPND